MIWCISVRIYIENIYYCLNVPPSVTICHILLRCVFVVLRKFIMTVKWMKSRRTYDYDMHKLLEIQNLTHLQQYAGIPSNREVRLDGCFLPSLPGGVPNLFLHFHSKRLFAGVGGFVNVSSSRSRGGIGFVGNWRCVYFFCHDGRCNANMIMWGGWQTVEMIFMNVQSDSYTALN